MRSKVKRCVRRCKNPSIVARSSGLREDFRSILVEHGAIMRKSKKREREREKNSSLVLV